MGRLLVLLFSVVSLYSSEIISPSWFNEHNIEKYVYSYGHNINQAKNEAKNKLEKIINKTISNNDFEVVKKESFENKVFLKIKYINQSLENQIKNELKKIPFKSDELNNKYLIKTNFYKDLNETFGYFPNVELNNNYLYFKDKRFLIKKDEFKDFFTEITDINLTIDSKKIIKNNENFFFEINNNTKGYISMAIVVNNKLSLLFKNKKDISNIVYPNYKVSDGFTILLDKNENNSQAFVILTSCEKKKGFKNYKMEYEKSTKYNLNFSDFINEINDCKISTKILKVVK